MLKNRKKRKYNMKQKLVLFGAIFMFCSLAVRAQVQEMIYQGFEVGETQRYRVTPTTAAVPSTTVYMSGERSIELIQRSDSETVFILDTLDFRSNTALRYIALQFDHICHVPLNSSQDREMCMIFYKRANQSDDQWMALSTQEYDRTGTYSSEFTHVGAFNSMSYPVWNDTASVPNNSLWKSERFNLNTVMTGTLDPSQRLLLIKFVIKHRTIGGQANPNRIGWWLDNIKVSSSADPMVTPKINMMMYPDGYFLASSRGARIELEATTAVAAGINPDSVYINYKVGSDQTVYRVTMTPKPGVANRYVARIPFCGYDTVMQFYCVVRDATSNANRVTFPAADNSWVSYICVRGTSQPAVTTPPGYETMFNYDLFPFPSTADHKSEFIYDSALLADAGYGPGAITSFRYTLAGNTVYQNRPRFQLRMKNIPADYVADSVGSSIPFTSSYMHIVYDSAYNIGTLSAGTQQTFNLQDTFFYAGKDLMVQIIIDGNADPSATSIKHIRAHNAKHSLIRFGVTASLGANAFTSVDFNKANYSSGLRPAFIFSEYPNQPLVYDAGISELVDPNFTVPMTVIPGSIAVKLKNYGAAAFNAITISYSIDDTVTGSYDWTGTLNGSQTLNAGDEVLVTIANSVVLGAGYHTLKVWVEDTLTANGQLFRDHEPLNDTLSTPFIVCEGPLGGVRNIGGNNPDYNTIEEFLLSLNRCGMNDSLIVRLAPGSYPAFTMPTVNGLSEQNYLVFESMNDTKAALYADTLTSQASIANLENVANVRFRNVCFVRRNASIDGTLLSNMVLMGPSSVNCRFEKCDFIDSVDNPVAPLRIVAMLNNGYASNLLVDSCTFVGGRVGVDVKGLAPDIRATGNVVKHCLFRNQNESAVRVENQTGIIIEDNEMYDVLGNSSYVVQMSECYGPTRLQRNRIYTSHGAGAVGVSNIIGTETVHALVANNMVVCNDDGTANLMRTAFNIIQATYLDVFFNSVKMTAPARGNVAAATFGGGVLNNSRFMNNIVVTLDEVNYALSYLPLTSTTNIVCNNVYYSLGPVMNRRGSASYSTVANWATAVPEDTTSLFLNPNFLNGSLVDLRTYNRQVKGLAVPMASVPTDLFGTPRDTVGPCVGAFEFVSLGYDFEPETMLSPLAEDCYMPDQVELVIVMRNSGVNSYTYGAGQNLQLSYQVNGGTVTTFNVTQSVPAEDTVTLYTGHTVHLPANGVEDSTYHIRVWTSFGQDPNQTNDTNTFTVISRYHPAAPTDDTVWTGYATSAIVTPTNGVDTWSVYEDAAAPERPSQIYWYHTQNDAEPFYVGHTYTTDTLRENTQYYIRQRRAMPIVRFTQVEIIQPSGTNIPAGITTPMPYWMNTGRKAAVQLTNIGDATAYLQGDTLMTVSPNTSGLNAKYYVFGDVAIEPGRSLVVQFLSSTAATDPNWTVYDNASGNTAINYNTNIAFVYKTGGRVEDAVPFNAVITATTNYPVKWSTLGVPSYVWNGGAIPFENGIAGVYRTAFNGDSTDWVYSTNDNPMFLGSTNSEWVRYIDRGCEGELATMTVAILNPPAVELAVGEPVLPDGGCGLGDENVTVTVHNYGTNNVDSFQLNYSTGGTSVVTETVTVGVASNDSVTYTFNTPLNLSFGVDTEVVVYVWVTAYPGDNEQANDTNQATVVSRFTPGIPDTIADRTVAYAGRDTITIAYPSGTIPVWYDYDMNAVDTSYTHVSDILYYGGTMGVRYTAIYDENKTVGLGITLPTKTAYPQPYQPNNTYAKQQYIFSPSELAAAGLTAGNIYSISFFLDSIYKVNNTTQRDSVVFSNYKISLGLASDTIFSANNAWKTTTEVFQRQPLTIYRSQSKQWITHEFDTPFYWDGTSSLVVQLYHTVPTAITTGVQSRYTSKANTTLYKAQNSALAEDFSGNGTRNANRPNIMFGSKGYGCAGDMRTYQVHVNNVPAVDAALSWPSAGGTGEAPNSCDIIAPMVNIRNQGDSTLNGLKLYYFVDDEAVDSIFVTDTILPGQLHGATLFSRTFIPGRHTMTVVAGAENDNVTSNDTITRSFMVRFCGGIYTIGADSSADYHTFGAAIDTLNIVGIAGPVTFQVADGGYNEQVTLGEVYGSSVTNTITFSGQNDSVWLTAATTQANNFVMKLDGASNVRINNITIASRPASGNYGNALVIANSNNVSITNSNLRVKGTIANKDASCLVLQGDISGLRVFNNVMDSGFYAVNAGFAQSLESITVTNNTFNGFASWGIYLRGASSVKVDQNILRSGNATNSRGLIGIYLAAITDSVSVQKNQIYLIDATQGAKRGIQLENVCGTVLNQGYIANNMISTYGTASKGLPNLNNKTASAGIVIDSSSTYLNIFFNTVRVYGTNATNTADMSYGFFSGNTVSHLQVLNNIFSNFSYGFTYYVAALNTVTTSNFNAYYTQSAAPFFWGLGYQSLAMMQGANGDDGNSLFEEPYFVSIDDLHLTMTNLVDKAQYNTEVPDDIDGNIRPQIPTPTIGAHEMERLTHDMAIVRIIEPVLNANPQNVESDSLRVIVKFYNNGRSNELNVRWYTYLKDHEAETHSDTISLGSFLPAQFKTDTVMIPTVLGIIDMQLLRVMLICETDTTLDNNYDSTHVFLDPAYNLKADAVTVLDNPAVAAGCDMNHTQVKITLKNQGRKTFAAGMQAKIGYQCEVKTPANLVIPGMTGIVEEWVTFDDDLLPLASATKIFDFDSLANLYPTDTALNIVVKVRGWCYYQYDITHTNDTTAWVNKNSHYRPTPPLGHDTTLAYGTWGAVRAEQHTAHAASSLAGRPIRWHRDSTDAPFYSPNNYNTSRIWNNTPQYFHDSTYYLQCFSDKNCPSYFSSVTVHVAPPVEHDMAYEAVLAPLGSRVYMEDDTVRVRIANYGYTAESNFPITYQLKKNNNILQTVTETVTATILPGDTYVFTFDTLLNITNTLTAVQNYTLKVWTDLATDMVRRNDTIRTPYAFTTKPESTYNAATPPGTTTFDITRVSFNQIDIEMPPLANRGYNNLASFTSPDYPVVHVHRGTQDSLVLQITPFDATMQTFRLKAWAFIDYDRSGVFSLEEMVVSGETFYEDETPAYLITIPQSASYGYMRMRVVVGMYSSYSDNSVIPFNGVTSDYDGHAIDFLLYVDEEPPAKDLALTQFISMRNPLVLDHNPKQVKFRMTNLGTQAITNVDINYSFVGDTIDTTAAGVIHWTGNLAGGTSTIVSLPEHLFPYGTSTLTIWHEMEGDLNASNNILTHEYNKFYVVTLIMNDDFESDDLWYAPAGYNENTPNYSVYTHNYWERGMPRKTRIDTTYSGENAWVTDLRNNIATGTRGNVSYLYTPIINISQIRPDTISFRLRRNLINGSALHIEFYNFENKWVKLDHDSVLTFYTDLENRVFEGTTSNNESYTRYFIPSSLVSGDFPERLQFRFVYTTPMGAASAAFGEGCAVDDFRIGRARRNVDVGVIDITKPIEPKYGQTLYPEVVVKNYGTDTIRQFQIAYTHYGTNLPSESTVNTVLAPLATDTFLFDAPFIVTSDFPDTFYIQAFTIQAADIYYDNDSAKRPFYLSPLDNDISAEEFLAPLDYIIAGDTSVHVTMRVRNFGVNPIYHAVASYTVNGLDLVNEELNFNALLGRPLLFNEYYNYTFHQPMRAYMGLMNLTAYVKSDTNEYIYNDTITKRVEGITSVSDLAAAAVILDTLTSINDVRIGLVIDNRGARGANYFEVGYWIDNDTSTMVRETYGSTLPLPALSRGYYLFDSVLPVRPAPYNHVSAFVHIDNDNDPSNDTTNVFAEQYTDIEVVKVLVEENASNDCRVFIELRNIGNLALVDKTLRLRATINGNELSYNVRRRINAGQTIHVEFDRTIPKSPTRHYEGTGRVLEIPGDNNNTNNQTSVVEVVNYVEGIPTVNADRFILDQNYPNPFTHQTTVPFTLPNAATVRFFVMDAMGHIVHSAERFYQAGDNTITIDMDAYPAGFYFYGIEVDGQRQMRKMILR